jgi:hypothetical protein
MEASMSTMRGLEWSMVLGLAGILGGCGGRMATVSGTLKAKQSAPITAVASVPGQQRVTAPVAADGRFSLTVPADHTYRVRFVSTRNGKSFVVGTVSTRAHQRLQLRAAAATTSNIELGEVGDANQDSASGAADCSADGEELDATGDDQDQQGQVSSDDGDHDVQQDDPCGENESESGGEDS